MPQAKFDLDEFPDSPYAQEMRRGVAALRFAPELEAEFIRSHLRHVQSRVRLWYTLNLPLLLFFTIDQIRSSGLFAPDAIVHYLIPLPLASLLTWSSWSARYERTFMPLSRLVTPLLGLCLGFFAAQAVAQGEIEDLIPLTFTVACSFFMMGLLFRAALATAVAALASFALGGLVFGMQPELLGKALFFLLVVIVLSAFLCRDMQRASRRSFLESGLIGELVARDGLTGLKNRRAFDEHLERVWKQAARDRRHLAVLLIDVDHFKRYNDRYGHQSGDATLRRVAQTVQSFLHRPLDMAARYGGEEFGVVLYDMLPEYVLELTEHLREAIERLDIRHDGSPTAPVVTVSIGVAIVEPRAERSTAGAVQLADQALYRAKAAGRNRVEHLGLGEYDAHETGTFEAPQLTPLA